MGEKRNEVPPCLIIEKEFLTKNQLETTNTNIHMMANVNSGQHIHKHTHTHSLTHQRPTNEGHLYARAVTRFTM